MFTPQRRSLLAFALACLFLLLPSLLAFLVNLELALRLFAPDLRALEGLLPAAWFHFGAVLSADLSTISTLVPVLLLAFPLVQLARILRAGEGGAALAREMRSDPYPPHFAFFLVMLGLVGTLYGMLIGLQGSGVATLADTGLNQASVQQTLDRLIGGTATAILSSLVGIIGAFLVARPIPWLFRRLTGIEQEESRLTLTDTLAELTHDLQNLGAAARGLLQEIPSGSVQEFRAQMERLEAGVHAAVRHLEPVSSQLAAIRQEAALVAGHAARLEGLERAVQEQANRLDELKAALAALGVQASRTNELLERRLREAGEQQQALLQPLAALAEAGRESERASRADRESLRRALAQYAGNGS